MVSGVEPVGECGDEWLEICEAASELAASAVRDVLAALGLRRRQQTVFHPVEPQFAGMIMKVKELVKVQEVERRLTKQEVKAERKPDPGFWVERAVPR